MIRVPFRGMIRPFVDDPTREEEVIWYPVSEKSAHMPWPVSFANSIYSPRLFKPKLGMTYDFDPGRFPVCPDFVGVAPCGTRDQWQNGCLTTDPVCPGVGVLMGPVQEVPAGVVDGVNAVFTLSQRNYANADLLVFVNGIAQNQGVNYTIAGQTITFTAPSTPRAGNTVFVMYWVC